MVNQEVCTIITTITVTNGAFMYVEILSGPSDQVVPPGKVAYFNCHARGHDLTCTWYINGTISSPRQYYNDRGFQFMDQQLSDNECNDTLIVIAHHFNNGTEIACTARVYGEQDTSQSGTLLLAGNRRVLLLQV